MMPRSFYRGALLAIVRRAGFASSAILLLLFFAAGLLRSSASPQQSSPASTAAPRAVADTPPALLPPGDSIGVIEGDAIAITGPMSVEVVHGQVKTVLRSGSDVRVKSGTARIDLIEGGLITICGPAHLSILKSGGAVTVALESGTIHARIQQSPILTVYTPQIKAQPIAIGDAAFDLLVGFDNPGTMCVRAAKGAVRLEQQLTGQSLVIPQTGDVLLTNGQLDSLQTSSGRCLCELSPLNAPPDSQTGTSADAQPQVSQLATSEDLRKRTFDTKPNLPAPAPQVENSAPQEAPIYEVIVPPLVYIANAKTPPEFDPAMIILVRRVRVRPTVIFQGRVLDEPGSAVATTASNVALPPATPAKPPVHSGSANNPSLVDRMKTFIQKLWTPGS
ncbi:MAG: hypothetical protein ABSG16_17190 [Candidatus Acidiferrum sp.]|jgi:hypothetical protein